MEETTRTTVPDDGALEWETSAPAHLSALERERLVAEIARKVRSELDLDEVLQIAVSETGRALGVVRCFIRLGQADERMPVKAEWHARGLQPLGDSADRLAVSNLAARERRTVAIADVENAPELEDASLGRPEVLVSVGARSALATPILVFGQMIGVFGLHRGERGAWSPGELSLAEAVAGEVGLAIHAARLLAEDRRRLEQQAALLSAAQVVTSDLRFESVLRRLVDEVATLFGADAADCWMLEPGSDALRCRAVFGLPTAELGRLLAPAGSSAAAIESGGPVLRRGVAGTEELPASESFAAFQEVMVAPISWLGEVRGVLGVYAREPGRFDASQLELLDAFARFASLASNNAESFEEHERQAQIQQGFYRIAEVLGSPLSLSETLGALAEAAAEALGAESAVVLEPRRERAVLAGSFGVPPALATRLREGVDVSAMPFAAAASEERIIASTALRDDDRLGQEVRELFQAHGYEALLSAPVSAGRGEVSAVVVLFR
ncbi:MAG: GAF domain-containing protein, partial [Actinomycetota bacterium]|nr:GAF domain-containing protein [Actinomycetota bacterium]